MHYYRIFLFIFFTSLATFPAYSQLTVVPGLTAASLTATLTGPGVTTLNPTLTCPTFANGSFTASGTLLGMTSGILLTNGHAAAAAGPYGPPPGTASFNDAAPGDPSLTALLGGSSTYDACVLQFDVVASGDSIGFNYLFGSQEYYSAVCSHYNDLFAFFISGPGITGSPNMALVPGTNIPVEINSVNDGIPGVSGGVMSNCTSLGAGSPFTAYYIDNTAGTQLSYKGFTTKFRAIHAVTPCDTYHLKLAIADAGNAIYDSGVFLEAGSLTTNNFSFNHTDPLGAIIDGIPHTIVKGCSPATATIVSSHLFTTSETLHFSYGGSAIRGTDYTAPDSAVLAAGADSLFITITGLSTPLTGPKTIEIYLSTAVTCGILDSITIHLVDSPYATLLTPDTTVCPGTPVLLRVSASAGMTFNWSPAGSLSSPVVMQPTATPSLTTSYTLTATLPGSGCPAITRSLNITTDSLYLSILTPDTAICRGQSVHILTSGSDSLSYTWTPAAGLDSIHSSNPLATPDSTTIYALYAHSAAGCSASLPVTISILSFSAHLSNSDTAICRGASVQVIASGDSGLTYQWLPAAGIPNSTIINPLITPDTSATYYLTGSVPSVPGCHALLDSVKIDVQPIPRVYAGGNRQVCSNDTIHIHAYVNPPWYTHYSFHWSPSGFLDDSTTQVVVFTPGDSTELTVAVTTPAGCRSADSATVITYAATRDSLGNVTLCPGDSVQLKPVGGLTAYHWSPGMYLSDSNAWQPWVHSITTTDYRLIEINQYGCRDTLSVTVHMLPAAVINVGDSVTLHPGDSYQVPTQTNCTFFSWFPPAGLNSAEVPNAVAQPLLSTKYKVLGKTEWGCTITDSLDILVDPGTLLAIPNAFSPGNGPNNVLRIIKNGEATLTYFRVYNRWGNKVFETTNINEGWDGSYHGVQQPFDVYVYIVEAVTSTGNTFQKQGNVTLIH